MANKKNKSKSKLKWILGGGILVVIAVVLIIVCTLPVNNDSVIRALNGVPTCSIVQNEENKSNYLLLQNSIESNVSVKYYSDEIQDVYLIMQNIDEISDFYNDNYIYAQANGVRKANASTILSSANNIKNIQKEMNSILKNVDSKAGSSFLQNNWVEFRRCFANQLEQYAKMFKSLNKVYQGAMGDSLVNNSASTQILNCIDSYMDVLTSGFDALVEKDVKGSLQSAYSYELADKVQAFARFTEKYVEDREIIQCYYFTPYSQNFFQTVGEFYQTFSEESLQPVIENITNQGGLLNSSYTANDLSQDALVVLTYAKAFVLGG